MFTPYTQVLGEVITIYAMQIGLNLRDIVLTGRLLFVKISYEQPT